MGLVSKKQPSGKTAVFDPSSNSTSLSSKDVERHSDSHSKKPDYEKHLASRKTIQSHLGFKKGDYVESSNNSGVGRITKITKYGNGNVFASILKPSGVHYGSETSELKKSREPHKEEVTELNKHQPKHDKYLKQFPDGKF